MSEATDYKDYLDQRLQRLADEIRLACQGFENDTSLRIKEVKAIDLSSGGVAVDINLRESYHKR